MKKIYILGASIVGIASFLMLIAFMISGFNFYEVTNYGNFKQQKFSEFGEYDIKLINCEFIIVDNNSRELISMTYHTSEKIDYEITYENEFVIIEQIGSDILNSVVPGADKPLTISIPRWDTSRKIVVESVDREDSIIRIDDVTIDSLTIDSNDTTITLDYINCINIDIKGEGSTIDFYDMYCINMNIDNKYGKVKLINVYFQNLELIVEDTISCIMQFPLTEESYKIINGNEITGSGDYTLLLNIINTEVQMTFAN